MSNENVDFQHSQPWELLYKAALFEVDIRKMPHRIELAKHAIFDRMEDITCTRTKESFQPGELAALRKAHRALRVLEQLYLADEPGKLVA
jgi:hypothetical protein